PSSTTAAGYGSRANSARGRPSSSSSLFARRSAETRSGDRWVLWPKERSLPGTSVRRHALRIVQSRNEVPGFSRRRVDFDQAVGALLEDERVAVLQPDGLNGTRQIGRAHV